MNINADFSTRASVHSAETPWRPSPMKGVERRMLDRIGEEVARATTIVRYAPGSHFSAHTHTGGEEFIVLDGVFQDEHGDYPAGTYVRNPPTSAHTPSAAEGATIMVKLWQFAAEDRVQLSIDTNAQIAQPVADRAGVSEIALFEDSWERVRIEVWAPNTQIDLSGHEGLEILVLEGQYLESGEEFSTHSWLRLPVGTSLKAMAGPQGARLWVKSGHLNTPQTAPHNAT